jgi:hypothetical protein
MEPRYGLIIGGSIMLGVSWLITAGTGAALSAGCDISYGVCPYTYWPTYIPVLGPFIQMAYVPSGDFSGAARFGLAFDGLVQVGGLAMIIVGATVRKKVPVYAQSFKVGPMLASGGSGLAISGTFR